MQLRSDGMATIQRIAVVRNPLKNENVLAYTAHKNPIQKIVKTASGPTRNPQFAIKIARKTPLRGTPTTPSAAPNPAPNPHFHHSHSIPTISFLTLPFKTRSKSSNSPQKPPTKPAQIPPHPHHLPISFLTPHLPPSAATNPSAIRDT